jgi:hypothetical protein
VDSFEARNPALYIYVTVGNNFMKLPNSDNLHLKTCLNRLISMKKSFNSLFLIILVFIFNSCHNQNSNITSELESIYLDEINSAKKDLFHFFALYVETYRDSYKDISELSELFKSIHEKIDKNDHKINTYLSNVLKLMKDDLSLAPVIKNLEVFIQWDFHKFNKRELRLFIYELNLKLLRELYFSFFNNDFMFNDIEVLVIPEKTRIKSGDDFKAEIKLLVVDTKNIAKIYSKNGDIELINGVGHLNLKSKEPGMFGYTGVVRVVKPNTGFVEFPFQVEYEVY